MTQYARQAVRRPCRSANVPANEADIPAETNPMRKRNATVSSGRPFSSIYVLGKLILWDCPLQHTFVNGVDVRSLEPIRCVD
jgi:hypothetical protein